MNLLHEILGGILNHVLIDGCKSAEDNQFEEEIGKDAKNNEVVKASLDLSHLCGPPVGNPVDEPQEVAQECDSEQKHQLRLIVLHLKNGNE